MEQRYLHIEDIETREEGNVAHICGYFAVFDSNYVLWEGATESIARGAFDDSISGDVRALWNHNTDIVLGRTGAGTFTLKQDEHGLWGDIAINLSDTDANNAYQRVARGDVSGCSIGFDIASETYEIKEDGSVHWTIEKIKPLYECSPCVFPAYTETSIAARHRSFDEIIKRKNEVWKTGMLERLKGAKNVKNTNAEKED